MRESARPPARPRVSGVYAITNTVTGEQYVGSARDIRTRWATHHRLLRRGRHISNLQRAWNTYGAPQFRLDVLESVTRLD